MPKCALWRPLSVTKMGFWLSRPLGMSQNFFEDVKNSVSLRRKNHTLTPLTYLKQEAGNLLFKIK